MTMLQAFSMQKNRKDMDNGSPFKRFRPWDHLGMDCTGITSVQEALKESGNDFIIEKKLISYEADGNYLKNVPNKVALVEKQNQTFCGLVRPNTPIIQNSKAFGFVDELIKKGATIERVGSTAGRLNFTPGQNTPSVIDGFDTFMICKLPEQEILGDEVAPFMVIKNSFGGDNNYRTKALSVALSPVRLACSNMLIALSEVARNENRLYETDVVPEDIRIASQIVENMLNIQDAKLNKIRKLAEEYAKVKLSKEDFVSISNLIFPVIGDLTPNQIEYHNHVQHVLLEAYDKEDLNNFRDTAWGVYNAFIDAIQHMRCPKEYRNHLDADPSNHMEEVFLKVGVLETLRRILTNQYGVKTKL